MFRTLIAAAALAVASRAAASIPVSPRDEARGVLRAQGLRLPPRPLLQSLPYQLTPDTEVWLDGRRADYSTIPHGARIESLEATPDGVILKIRFLSPVPRPPAGSGR